MKIKISEQRLKYVILMIIPILIFFAIEGIFSVQSIMPAILMLLCVDLMYLKIKIDKTMIIVIMFFIISTIGALVVNALTNNGLTTDLTYIRIIYYAIILYLYFSLTSIKYTSKQLNNIFCVNILCGVFVALYLIFINHIWFSGLLGTVLDKNFVGAILAVQGELAFIKFLKAKKTNLKAFFIICYLVILIGIFYSASRASVLVYILGTLIITFFYLYENANNKKGSAKLIISVFIIPLLCFGIFYYVSSKIENSNAAIQWYWNRYFINGFGDESVTGRWIWWQNALQLWQNRPLFGYGIGNVNISGNSSAVSHNTYIDFLVDQGLIGFIGFLLILKRSILKVIKGHNKVYYGLIANLVLNIFILSATRSTFLWYNLILLYCIGNCDSSSTNTL